jgi:hypothetical protein
MVFCQVFLLSPLQCKGKAVEVNVNAKEKKFQDDFVQEFSLSIPLIGVAHICAMFREVAMLLILIICFAYIACLLQCEGSGVFYCPWLLLPAFRAATGGGGETAPCGVE